MINPSKRGQWERISINLVHMGHMPPRSIYKSMWYICSQVAPPFGCNLAKFELSHIVPLVLRLSSIKIAPPNMIPFFVGPICTCKWLYISFDQNPTWKYIYYMSYSCIISRNNGKQCWIIIDGTRSPCWNLLLFHAPNIKFLQNKLISRSNLTDFSLL